MSLTVNGGAAQRSKIDSLDFGDGNVINFPGTGKEGEPVRLPDGRYSVGSETFHQLFGDLDGDGAVDINDLTPFGSAYGSSAGDPNYVAAFDFDGDGEIGAADFMAFFNNFGKAV